MPTSRFSIPRWLAAALIAVALGPALQDALEALRPERGCGCYGMACCRRSASSGCAYRHAGGRCDGDHSAAGSHAPGRQSSRSLSPSCGCSHPAPLGSAAGTEIAALVVPLATLVPPEPRALVASPWRGAAGTHVRAPVTPPPRPVSFSA